MPLKDVPISPLKKTSSRTNLKTHCSFDAKPSENLDDDLFLAAKATSVPLTDGSISPTKVNEQKPIYLFGTRIPIPPQDSSSLACKATSMPLTDVTVSSPTKKRSRTSMMQDGFCLGSNPKEIKKMRYLWNKERKGVKRNGVSTELDLNTPPCTITKELTASDIGHLSKIMLERSHAESHILNHLSEDDQRKIQAGEGVKVKVYDHDTNTEHSLVLKRMVKTTRSYVLNGGWVKEFVRRRDLKKGHKIGLFWNSVDSRLHFCVLSPAPADQENQHSLPNQIVI